MKKKEKKFINEVVSKINKKEKLINDVIEQIKKDLIVDDVSAIEELLKNCPDENLKSYLPVIW